MVTRLKLHWPMVAWGLAFGLAATLTGMYVLAAVEAHGFLAEGFFLLVMGWVIIFAGVAKAISKLSGRRREPSDEMGEK